MKIYRYLIFFIFSNSLLLYPFILNAGSSSYTYYKNSYTGVLANASISPVRGNAPLEVNLNAGSSIIGSWGGAQLTPVNASQENQYPYNDFFSVTYVWDSSDGQIVAGKTAKLFYDKAGIYQITLTVKNNGGILDSTTLSVNVLSNEPDNDELKEEFDNGYQSGEENGIQQGKLACLEEPKSCGITIESLGGFTAEQLDEAKNSAIQDCKNSPSSCDILPQADKTLWALNIPNPEAIDLGVIYITNINPDIQISHIYGTMYVKGTAKFIDKDLLGGDFLDPWETRRITSTDLSYIGGTWNGRAIMKLDCSYCTSNLIKFMVTGRRIQEGGPLVDLTAEVSEVRKNEQGFFTILGIPPKEGEDKPNIRINNLSTETIKVTVNMYDGYNTVIGIRKYSIKSKNYIRLAHVNLETEWDKNIPGSWYDENAWMQIVTDTSAGITRVQYLMRDKTTGILSNLSVGSK